MLRETANGSGRRAGNIDHDQSLTSAQMARIGEIQRLAVWRNDNVVQQSTERRHVSLEFVRQQGRSSIDVERPQLGRMQSMGRIVENPKPILRVGAKAKWGFE